MTTAELRELLAKATPTEFVGYYVTANGDILSTIPWRGQHLRVMTPFPNSHGYLRVKIHNAEGKGSAFVHKIACAAFHGHRPSPQHEVRHLNGDRTDNRAANLAWGTRSENALDRQGHGTEKAAANGKAGAHKLRGPRSEYCIRGHHKEGKRSCYACFKAQREARKQEHSK